MSRRVHATCYSPAKTMLPVSTVPNLHADMSAHAHWDSMAPNANFLGTLAEWILACTTVMILRHLYRSACLCGAVFRNLSEYIAECILLFLHTRLGNYSLRDIDKLLHQCHMLESGCVSTPTAELRVRMPW